MTLWKNKDINTCLKKKSLYCSVIVHNRFIIFSNKNRNFFKWIYVSCGKKKGFVSLFFLRSLCKPVVSFINRAYLQEYKGCIHYIGIKWKLRTTKFLRKCYNVDKCWCVLVNIPQEHWGTLEFLNITLNENPLWCQWYLHIFIWSKMSNLIQSNGSYQDVKYRNVSR